MSARDSSEAGWGIRTTAVHAGIDRAARVDPIGPSIVPSVNFAAEWNQIGASAAGTDEQVSFVYAREGHPNATQLEQRLAALEGAEDAAAFASGMAAISGVLGMLLAPGDHLVISDVVYAGTAEYVKGPLARTGVSYTVADMADLADVTRSLRTSTRVIYAETPCNPIIKLADVRALASIAHDAGAELIVDSTFSTPIISKPLELGADYVVHSLTKYIGGHGDALGGAVLGAAEPIRRLRREIGTHLGATLSPFNAWLIMRGIETLPIRVKAHSESAQTLASYLASHPAVSRVIYPGLRSHPQFELAREQMAMFGGMLACSVRNTRTFGDGLASTLRLIRVAASLGATRSVILYCDTADLQRMTFQLDEEHLRRYRTWAGDGVFRVSVGLEDAEDLCDDFARALEVAA